ncbi:unnamed protein product [Amoebophrya sp. A120]|nr:unnamed protein product [Amoebophrya sp. A120]|eukprot:GSA120T00010758001.1
MNCPICWEPYDAHYRRPLRWRACRHGVCGVCSDELYDNEFDVRTEFAFANGAAAAAGGALQPNDRRQGRGPRIHSCALCRANSSHPPELNVQFVACLFDHVSAWPPYCPVCRCTFTSRVGERPFECALGCGWELCESCVEEERQANDTEAGFGSSARTTTTVRAEVDNCSGTHEHHRERQVNTDEGSPCSSYCTGCRSPVLNRQFVEYLEEIKTSDGAPSTEVEDDPPQQMDDGNDCHCPRTLWAPTSRSTRAERRRAAHGRRALRDGRRYQREYREQLHQHHLRPPSLAERLHRSTHGQIIGSTSYLTWYHENRWRLDEETLQKIDIFCNQKEAQTLKQIRNCNIDLLLWAFLNTF